ncbi:MAG: carbamoyltransferase HypF [Proteobacteria bacterium]|nr:carbamoyltransferase HypF [Pseudomonadota bacterium]
MPDLVERYRLTLSGVVQGIGLRPFLHNIAKQQQLTGWVQNKECEVLLEWQGKTADLHEAIGKLNRFLLPYGQQLITKKQLAVFPESDFAIIQSEGQTFLQGGISPDIALCQTCVEELYDNSNRRFHYPFITCAQCGPRFTITSKLPYDRKNTSMAKYPLCKACDEEYTSSYDRRFHAQTISCHDCGPQLWLTDKTKKPIAVHQAAIIACCDALRRGRIVAVKGMGGFHLMCLATNDVAVQTLRTRKQRPHKPFAVMVRDLEQALALCSLNEIEKAALRSPQAPIVLAHKNPQYSLSSWVAPDSSFCGMMLAYTPLHHLLLSSLNEPLVATSGNLSDDPIEFINEQALESLQDVADLWLLNDRDIIHPLEDSVMHVVNTEIQFIRRARGFVPFSFSLPSGNHSTISLGGHLKNTVALHVNNQMHISAYIGDLSSQKSIDRFQKTVENYLNIAPKSKFIGDKHHEYASTVLAHTYQEPPYLVAHHIAHVFAVMAEHGLRKPVLGFAWDGIGLGLDQKLWGGETFYIDKTCDHVATLATFYLPGGEMAIREPRRVALSLLYTIFNEDCWQMFPAHLLHCFPSSEKKVFLALLKGCFQNPACTSMGRLFDAIAFLLGGMAKMTYEGQAASYVEQLATTQSQALKSYPVVFIEGENKLVIDWRPMLLALLEDISQQIAFPSIAWQFHRWCADVICKIASKFDCQQIILSGGVFQNKLLTELTFESLRQSGYHVYCAKLLPPNDGALSVGQALAYQYFGEA